MQIEFLTEASPGRGAVERHIREVYARSYGARIDSFAPLLAAATTNSGRILCAAGIRTAPDGFFADRYVDQGLPAELMKTGGLRIEAAQIMEVSSLASVSPFPVLPMLDRMIHWGRDRGLLCGVFTATLPLRKLLTRTGLGYIPLCPASPDRVDQPEMWGSYYDTDPWVCAFVESETRRARLTPLRGGIRHDVVA